MRFFPELRNRLRDLIFGVAIPHPNTPEPLLRENLPAVKAGRPISAALSKTLEALAVNPGVTAAELSSSLSVTPSYARTLLRRARARCAERSEAHQPNPTPRLAAVTTPPASATPSLQDLSMRLAETEKCLAALRSNSPHARGSLTPNRRTEILRLSEAGHDAAAIAQRLGIPTGEAEFVLKIDRMLAAALQAR